MRIITCFPIILWLWLKLERYQDERISIDRNINMTYTLNTKLFDHFDYIIWNRTPMHTALKFHEMRHHSNFSPIDRNVFFRKWFRWIGWSNDLCYVM